MNNEFSTLDDQWLYIFREKLNSDSDSIEYATKAISYNPYDTDFKDDLYTESSFNINDKLNSLKSNRKCTGIKIKDVSSVVKLGQDVFTKTSNVEFNLYKIYLLLNNASNKIKQDLILNNHSNLPKVQSNSSSTRRAGSPPEVGPAVSSSNYLSLKSRATPGDRGDVNPEERNVQPLRTGKFYPEEQKISTRKNEDCLLLRTGNIPGGTKDINPEEQTSCGSGKPAADLREAEGEVNREGLHGEWKTSREGDVITSDRNKLLLYYDMILEDMMCRFMDYVRLSIMLSRYGKVEDNGISDDIIKEDNIRYMDIKSKFKIDNEYWNNKLENDIELKSDDDNININNNKYLIIKWSFYKNCNCNDLFSILCYNLLLNNYNIIKILLFNNLCLIKHLKIYWNIILSYLPIICNYNNYKFIFNLLFSSNNQHDIINLLDWILWRSFIVLKYTKSTIITLKFINTLNNTLNNLYSTEGYMTSVPLAGPPEVSPAVSSSNYLSLKGDATPGDRGDVNPEEQKVLTRKNENIQPLRTGLLPGGTENVNPEEQTSNVVTGPQVEPAADLREAKGEVNRGGHHGEWKKTTSGGKDGVMGYHGDNKPHNDNKPHYKPEVQGEGSYWTSSGIPGSDLREFEGEVNRRATTASGKTSGGTSSGNEDIMVDKIGIDSSINDRLVILRYLRYMLKQYLLYIDNRYSMIDIKSNECSHLNFFEYIQLDSYKRLQLYCNINNLSPQTINNDCDCGDKYRDEYGFYNGCILCKSNIIIKKLKIYFKYNINNINNINNQFINNREFYLYFNSLIKCINTPLINYIDQLYKNFNDNLTNNEFEILYSLISLLNNIENNNNLFNLLINILFNNNTKYNLIQHSFIINTIINNITNNHIWIIFNQSYNLSTTNPPEVTSTNSPTSFSPAVSSSNYLPLKGDATPGDRGSEEGNDWTSSGGRLSETIHGSRGELNKEAVCKTTKVGDEVDSRKVMDRTSSGKSGVKEGYRDKKHNNNNQPHDIYNKHHKNNIPYKYPHNSPPEIRPAVSSSNYLSLKGIATPGDRGEISETIHGSRGEVNVEGSTPSGMEGGVSTGPQVEPAADLREAEGELNRRGHHGEWEDKVDVTSGGVDITSSNVTDQFINSCDIKLPVIDGRFDIENSQLRILIDDNIDRSYVISLYIFKQMKFMDSLLGLLSLLELNNIGDELYITTIELIESIKYYNKLIKLFEKLLIFLFSKNILTSDDIYIYFRGLINMSGILSNYDIIPIIFMIIITYTNNILYIESYFKCWVDLEGYGDKFFINKLLSCIYITIYSLNKQLINNIFIEHLINTSNHIIKLFKCKYKFNFNVNNNSLSITNLINSFLKFIGINENGVIVNDVGIINKYINDDEIIEPIKILGIILKIINIKVDKSLYNINYHNYIWGNFSYMGYNNIYEENNLLNYNIKFKKYNELITKSLYTLSKLLWDLNTNYQHEYIIIPIKITSILILNALEITPISPTSSLHPDVTTTVGLADNSSTEVSPAVSSSNYLSLKGKATPGDRGEGGMDNSTRPQVEPVADLREAEGEINREADGRTTSGVRGHHGEWKETTLGGKTSVVDVGEHLCDFIPSLSLLEDLRLLECLLPVDIGMGMVIILDLLIEILNDKLNPIESLNKCKILNCPTFGPLITRIYALYLWDIQNFIPISILMQNCHKNELYDLTNFLFNKIYNVHYKSTTNLQYTDIPLTTTEVQSTPLEVQSNSLPLAVEASSNSLPVDGKATPGDRGGSNIVGDSGEYRDKKHYNDNQPHDIYNKHHKNNIPDNLPHNSRGGTKSVNQEEQVVKVVTSSGTPRVEPESDPRELEGEVNREGSTPSGEDKEKTSGGDDDLLLCDYTVNDFLNYMIDDGYDVLISCEGLIKLLSGIDITRDNKYYNFSSSSSIGNFANRLSNSMASGLLNIVDDNINLIYKKNNKFDLIKEKLFNTKKNSSNPNELLPILNYFNQTPLINLNFNLMINHNTNNTNTPSEIQSTSSPESNIGLADSFLNYLSLKSIATPRDRGNVGDGGDSGDKKHYINNKHHNINIPDNLPHSSPPEVTSVPLGVEPSSNYLSLKSNATPGDRGGGEGSDGSSIMGMMEDGAKDVLDVTSSGMKSSTGHQVKPVADLREAKGQLNREADGRTSSGGEWKTSGDWTSARDDMIMSKNILDVNVSMMVLLINTLKIDMKFGIIRLLELSLYKLNRRFIKLTNFIINKLNINENIKFIKLLIKYIKKLNWDSNIILLFNSIINFLNLFININTNLSICKFISDADYRRSIFHKIPIIVINQFELIKLIYLHLDSLYTNLTLYNHNNPHEVQSNPHNVQSTSPSTRRAAPPPEVSPAVSSSNYLSLKSEATPGDRGEVECEYWTSSGKPENDLREFEGEVNKKATTASGMKCSTRPQVEPVADLREAKGQLNRGAVCKTTNGGDSRKEMDGGSDVTSSGENGVIGGYGDNKPHNNIDPYYSDNNPHNINIPYNHPHNSHGTNKSVNPEEQEISTRKNVKSVIGPRVETSSGSGLPAADLREAEGEVNKKAATASGKESRSREDKDWTSSGVDISLNDIKGYIFEGVCIGIDYCMDRIKSGIFMDEYVLILLDSYEYIFTSSIYDDDDEDILNLTNNILYLLLHYNITLYIEILLKINKYFNKNKNYKKWLLWRRHIYILLLIYPYYINKFNIFYKPNSLNILNLLYIINKYINTFDITTIDNYQNFKYLLLNEINLNNYHLIINHIKYIDENFTNLIYHTIKNKIPYNNQYFNAAQALLDYDNNTNQL